MLKDSLAIPSYTIGLDLGDRVSAICVLEAAGTVRAARTIATTATALTALVAEFPGSRVVCEVGTHSPWISRPLQALGAEVYVANPSAMYGARRRRQRNDRMDAEFLARQGRADPALLHAITHRSATAQAQLEVLRARDQLVQVRTKLINHVRGTVKALGARLPAASAEAFVRRVAAEIPVAVHDAVAPLLDTIARLTATIGTYDRQVQQAIRQQYPVAQQLQQIAGVGPITALTFVLLVEDPARFAHSRDVGAYVGLVPRLDESSRQTPQLRITKAGDPLLRRLLVNAAHYILGPFGPPCDLRRHGAGIAARGGANAKKRAVVAVARKLAVLLHRLWVTGAPYDPVFAQRVA
jgi:transposase